MVMIPHLRTDLKLNPGMRRGRVFGRRATSQLARLDDAVKHLADPEPYLVGLELGLHDMKMSLAVRAEAEPET